MINNLLTNQLTDSGLGWYLSYLSALDAKDLDAYGTFLADDVVLQMNGGEPVVGKPAVLGMLGSYWPSFGTLEHELLNLLGDDETFVLEALNHYVRLDGTAVTLYAVAFTERDVAGFVRSVRFATDTSALFA